MRAVAGSPDDGGLLVALDYSAGTLTLADPAVPRIQADAAALPLHDGSADVAAYSFVLFLLPDARADIVVGEEVDAAGATPAPDLPRSDELTDSPDRMRELLEPAGFTDITTIARPLDARFDVASTLSMRTRSGSLGWRCAQLTPSAQARVRERSTARLGALGPQAFLDRSEVQLTTGRRT